MLVAHSFVYNYLVAKMLVGLTTLLLLPSASVWYDDDISHVPGYVYSPGLFIHQVRQTFKDCTRLQYDAVKPIAVGLKQSV